MWLRAGGRCQFAGCNQPLWKDTLTTDEFNRAQLAHIIAASADGPRGHRSLSRKLAIDPANLMLLCGTHHAEVDSNELAYKYPVELLQRFKKQHEQRIERLTAIAEHLKSVPLVFQAPIHDHSDRIDPEEIKRAITGIGRYPEDSRRIEINLQGLPQRDRDTDYWTVASSQLRDRFFQQTSALQAESAIDHLSIFGLAPIPLLVLLGSLIGDKIAADVFNAHRSPKGWAWPSDTKGIGRVMVSAPKSKSTADDVALVLSITSEVQRTAIAAQLPAQCPIFEIRVKDPKLDSMRRPEDLANFVAAVRQAMEAIHRSGAKRIHAFAAVPVAAAVEFGRSLLPKVHAELILYDLHGQKAGWSAAVRINQ